MYFSVCHLGLKLQWFNKIGTFARDRAKVIFEHVLKEYEASAPASAPPRSPTPIFEDEMDFLTTLATVPGAAPATVEETAVSEFERYINLGTVSRRNIMDNPLIWWKVCVRMAHFYSLVHSISSRITHTSSPLSLESLTIIL